MGQEIDSTQFSEADFQRFHEKLTAETALLEERFSHSDVAKDDQYRVGFELEACLVDKDSFQPAPINAEFLELFNDPELATMELARFNIEFNTPVFSITENLFSLLHKQLKNTWEKAQATAKKLDAQVLLCGILPTLQDKDLGLDNISTMKRYAALNRQILKSRKGKPINLRIHGQDKLELLHDDVMLESAATSFQIHFKTPLKEATDIYNASIMVSAPLLAASVNSPLLFGKTLWEETRIPLFEQAVATGNNKQRVSFGNGYAQDNILECFHENLEQYPVLLPMEFDTDAEEFSHARLHNGTLWRWNRPLIGFNRQGTPHVRIEFRCLPAGPSLIDTVANAAFYFGLCYHYANNHQALLDFNLAKDNFYQAARHGLNTEFNWVDGKQYPAKQLLLEQFLPEAEAGLITFGISKAESRKYLNIIHQRVETEQTGANWQKSFLKKNQHNILEMTRKYAQYQDADKPVHEWAL
ncbi:MAG TPA: glutamate--cysteine ligase [Chromatiales bacterium]|nr:glutamate--cysteine ligase [Chromatiales bacterium]